MRRFLSVENADGERGLVQKYSFEAAVDHRLNCPFGRRKIIVGQWSVGGVITNSGILKQELH